MVLRLIRLGKDVYPDSAEMDDSNSGKPAAPIADDLGLGEAPGMSSVLREDDDDTNDDDEKDGRAE
jgi:hypothetical protein